MVTTSFISESLEDLVTRVNTEVQNLNDRKTCLALLAGLPLTSPVPNAVFCRAYCADGALLFLNAAKQELDSFLQHYPPEPTVFLEGDNRSLKPKSEITKGERHYAMLDLHPVSRSVPNRATWWTRINRRLVKVTVEFAEFVEREVPARHGKLSGMNLYYPLVKVDLAPCDSPNMWRGAWLRFIEEQQVEKRLANLILEYSEKLVTVEVDPTLPRPRAWFLKQFSEEQSAAWAQLVALQARELPAAVIESNRQMKALRSAFGSFFQRRGPPSPWLREILASRVRQYISRKTGVFFHLDELSPVDAYGRAVTVRIRGFSNAIVSTFVVPCDDRVDLLLQAVPAEYA